MREGGDCNGVGGRGMLGGVIERGDVVEVTTGGG